jgi:hypothetical protein
MKKTLLTAFAVPLLATGLLAQSNQATMGASPHKVKQGEEIKFQVMVSPRSNVSGSVNVFIGPEGSTALNLNGGNGLTLGQTNVGDIGITIPIDATLGTWRVVKVRFQPANSPPSDLAVSGSTTFEVVKRDTVLPTSADVQVK